MRRERADEQPPARRLWAAIAQICNNGRANVYADTAAKSGVTRDAAGQATGATLIGRVPAGQYYKPLGGAWTKK